MVSRPICLSAREATPDQIDRGRGPRDVGIKNKKRERLNLHLSFGEGQVDAAQGLDGVVSSPVGDAEVPDLDGEPLASSGSLGGSQDRGRTRGLGRRVQLAVGRQLREQGRQSGDAARIGDGPDLGQEIRQSCIWSVS